ncbi:MAG: hypothetical protein ACD_20C00253G0001, partial [uncultured bacterium]
MKAASFIAGTCPLNSDLEQKKKALENKLDGLLHKSDYSDRDMKLIQTTFKNLLDIINQEIQNSWLSIVTNFIGDKFDKVMPALHDPSTKNVL